MKEASTIPCSYSCRTRPADNRFQLGMIHLTKEAVISPVGRQGLHDIKPAVMRNEAVVVQIVCQICDPRKPFTFHHKKRTEHRFFWGKAAPPSCRSGQCKLQAPEQPVIEYSGALGCEQCYILNDFLSVDSGQPLSALSFLPSQFYSKGAPLSTIYE